MAKADSYKRLLDKIGKMDLDRGGMSFWKPDPGRSTVRVLPPMGKMEFFFKEVGVHHLDSGRFYCPAVCTDGQEKCPICEVSHALYEAGEKELAGTYRVSRSFWMNVIVRGEEGSGPRIFTPGVTIFSTMASYIADPEYGDITDWEKGFDIKIDREGTGLKTEYQVRASREPSPLGTEEQVAEWLENAVDVDTYITGKIKSYDKLIDESGISVYYSGDSEKEKPAPKPEPKPEEESDGDKSASERIEELLKRRKR